MKYQVLQIKIRQCRVCGCTNYHACLGGCSWVEKDLCSRCAEKMKKRTTDINNTMTRHLVLSEINSSMTHHFVLPEIDPSMQLIVTDPKGELTIIDGEVEAGHKIPMSEFINSLSPSERRNCIIVDPQKEFKLVRKFSL